MQPFQCISAIRLHVEASHVHYDAQLHGWQDTDTELFQIKMLIISS